MSITGNLNYIKRIMRHPCATPDVMTVVETGLGAGALALLHLTMLGCNDILKARAGRSPWHFRKMSGLIKGAGGPVGRGVNRWLFATPYNQIEAVLWHMMVMEATTGFFADWASMMYQETRCGQPGAGHIHAPLAALYLDAGDEGTVLINNVEDKPCVRVGGNTVTIKAGCTGSISFHVDWKPFRDDPANSGSVQTYLREVGGGLMDESASVPSGPGGAQSSITMTTQRSRAAGLDRTFELKYFVVQGLMGGVGGRLDVSAYGRPIPLIPAGCKPQPASMPYPAG